MNQEFQSTLSARRATHKPIITASSKIKFQSTLSARRATILVLVVQSLCLISIHALREESDYIYTERILYCYDFNPRSPRGERLFGSCAVSFATDISIHALREESDLTESYFSTIDILISIHALREESDPTSKLMPRATPNFNPRSPRGERHDEHTIIRLLGLISIHALREESDVQFVPQSQFIPVISIHALREESDSSPSLLVVFLICISIHALREESDQIKMVIYLILSIFQSTLSARRATAKSNIIFTFKSTMYLHFFTKL